MHCSSCDKQKDKLFPRTSDLLGIKLYMCRSCIDAKMEPRWVIILSGRQYGSGRVKEYIIKRRYYGETIKAEEMLR